MCAVCVPPLQLAAYDERDTPNGRSRMIDDPAADSCSSGNFLRAACTCISCCSAYQLHAYGREGRSRRTAERLFSCTCLRRKAQECSASTAGPSSRYAKLIGDRRSIYCSVAGRRTRRGPMPGRRTAACSSQANRERAARGDSISEADPELLLLTSWLANRRA